MIRITESVSIVRSPAEVFAFAADYRNDPVWRSGVLEMTLDPTEGLGPGTQTREVFDFMGKRITTLAEVVRYDPGREIAFKALSGNDAMTGYRRIEPERGGTRLTYHIQSEPKGFARLLAPLVERSFRKRLLADLQHLKAHLENAGA